MNCQTENEFFHTSFLLSSIFVQKRMQITQDLKTHYVKSCDSTRIYRLQLVGQWRSELHFQQLWRSDMTTIRSFARNFGQNQRQSLQCVQSIVQLFGVQVLGVQLIVSSTFETFGKFVNTLPKIKLIKFQSLLKVTCISKTAPQCGPLFQIHARQTFARLDPCSRRCIGKAKRQWPKNKNWSFKHIKHCYRDNMFIVLVRSRILLLGLGRSAHKHWKQSSQS